MAVEGRNGAPESIPPSKRLLAWVKSARTGDDEARARIVVAIRAAISEVGSDQSKVAARLGISLRAFVYMLSQSKDERSLGLSQELSDVEW